MEIKSIGTIHSPYSEESPFRPDENADGEFFIDIEPALVDALQGLERFSHLVVLYHFHLNSKTHLKAHPPGSGKEVGTYASRSPNRVNKIGMNVVRILRIDHNRIYTSPMDAFDGSPVLDIKPYIIDLDCRPDANSGWLNS